MNKNLLFKKVIKYSGLYFLGTIFFLNINVVFANGLSNAQSNQPLSKIQMRAQQSQTNQPLRLTAVSPQMSYSHRHYDPQKLFPKPDTFQKQAFQSVTRSAMPMTPSQIIKLKKMLAVTERASASSGFVPPIPTLSTQVVNLSPGELPPVIRLQQGFVTSVVFIDDTGAEWPIIGYDLGNPRSFNIQWHHETNVLMIQAISKYTYGNLAVKLKGLSTPVMLTLVPGQRVVDYRVDLRIQQQGPNASPVFASHLPKAASNILLKILDGVSPFGAKSIAVTGGDAKAWLKGNVLYLRTRLAVLSPSWISVMTSPDGTKAYEMEKTPSILVSKYGKPVELRLETM